MKAYKTFTVFLFVLCAVASADAAVYYVNVNAAAGGGGSSWSDAYDTIQEGIDAANFAGGGEVWVAQGTYYIYSTSKNDTVFLHDDVELYGGFNGNETLRSQRNYESHVTVLDGHQSNGGAYQVNRVVEINNADNVVIDGFTIKGGNYANNPSPAPPDSPQRATNPGDIIASGGAATGAGMLIWQCGPTINNCIISENSAIKGAGVYIMGSTSGELSPNPANPAPTFTNCVFSDNTASARGGAVSIDVATHPKFIQCSFTNNNCDAKGGAIYVDWGCDPTFINCLIAENTAERAAGMGIDGTSFPKLVNCTVAYNSANDVGGGLYTGSYMGDPNDPVLINCIVWGNDNQYGGPADFNVWHENHFYISYSLIGEGFTSYGTGVIQEDASDPLFTDPTNGDYSLKSGSPCINTGGDSAYDPDVPSDDIDGTARDSSPDMGAYEYTGVVSDGYLTIALAPAGAVSAGAQWTVDSATYDSGDTATLSPGTYTVSYSSVTGYTAPASESVTITSGGTQSITATYTATSGSSEAFTGYTLYMPIPSTIAYLIDNDGNEVHSWSSSSNPALSVYLLENGNLLQTAKIQNLSFSGVSGGGGKVLEIESDGAIAWNYAYPDAANYLPHHDIEYMDNGNILMIVWEKKTAAESEDAGRDPSTVGADGLYPDMIVEIQPTGATAGTIVWEWHVWDHLVQDYDSAKTNYGVVADHPELIDINFVTSAPDITHFNSIDYNEEFDQILVSVHSYSEIWVIDHNTTTAEAAGSAGDLLYRWGNPQAYGAGTSADRKLYAQHDAAWIDSGYPGEGNILIFNNGQGRPGGNYSSVEEIAPPVDANGNYTLSGSAYGPDTQTWTYDIDPTYYSMNISGAQRLPNGNTLICSGANGYFLEVSSNKETVWEYTVSGGTDTFKIRRYGADYAGLNGLVDAGTLTVNISPSGASSAGAQWNINDGEWHNAGTLTAAAGTHTVNFSDVTNYTTPSSQSVTVPSGGTSEITGTYTSTSTTYDLSDALAILQMLTGVDTGTTSYPDPTGDGVTGVEDAFYILQDAAGLR